MGRFFKGIYLTLLLIGVLPWLAVGANGDELLRDISLAIKSLGCYDVAFAISTEASGKANSEQNGEANVEAIEGSYTVDEERYRLDLSGFMIYGSKGVRYSVDSVNREVVIEQLDEALPMVIVNPAKAFIGLDDEFYSEVVSEDNESVTLKLQPKKESVTLRSQPKKESVTLKSQPKKESVTLRSQPKKESVKGVAMELQLKISRETNLPKSITYNADNESINIEVKSFTKSNTKLSKIAIPTEYEVIDLR
ncbi:MAG: hypothetical protein SNG14_04610 [Rikenellaceae bacterium]